MEEGYVRLRQDQPEIPRAMTLEEQQRLLNTAASRSEWQVVYWYSIIALDTTASNCELRGLRLRDVNLYSRDDHVQPEQAKNRYRVRTIPLTGEALDAMQRLLDRARSLGSFEPHH